MCVILAGLLLLGLLTVAWRPFHDWYLKYRQVRVIRDLSRANPEFHAKICLVSDLHSAPWTTSLHDRAGFLWAGMPARLDLSWGLVSDLSSLKGMRLTELDLADTLAADLSPLKGMPLRRLILRYTGVTDLTPLQGMPLEFLDLSCTSVADLSRLEGMPLRFLDLDGTQVSDLSPLRYMSLQGIHLDHTRVADLSPLKGMPLTFLSFVGTPVLDLSPLKGMPLRDLILWDTPAAERPSACRHTSCRRPGVPPAPVPSAWKILSAYRHPIHTVRSIQSSNLFKREPSSKEEMAKVDEGAPFASLKELIEKFLKARPAAGSTSAPRA